MWEKPRFTELEMNAEIGAYQDETDRGNVPVVEAVELDTALKTPHAGE